MASNTVDIYFKGHNSGLTRSIAEVQSKLRALRDQTVRVKVDVDDAALGRLQQRLRAIGNETVRVRVATDDNRGLRQSVRDLISNREARVRVNVSNLASVEGQLARLTRDRTVNVRTRINVSEVDRLTRSLARLGSGAAGAGAGASVAARGIAQLGMNASASLAKMTGLTTVLAPLASGAVGAGIFAVAGALGAVTAAAGALSVGFGAAVAAIPIAAAAASDQVRDHFSFMADDVVSTMKEIAVPLQQPLVNLATALGAAFHQIRPNLEAITTGVGGLVDELAGKMPAIAAAVGPALQKMFEGAVPHIRNMIDNMPALIDSFGQFASKLADPAIVEGAQRVFANLPDMISGAGDALVGLADGFNSVMGYLDSGALDGFTSGIGTFIDNLQGTDWSGVTSGLSEMANSFGSFLANIDTANLATNISGITSALSELTNVASGVTSAFQGADDWVRNLSDQVNADAFQIVPDDFANKINGFLDSIGAIDWQPEVNVEPQFSTPGGVNPLDTLNGALGGAPLEVPATVDIQPLAPGEMPPIPLIGNVETVTPPTTALPPIPLPATVENVEQPTVPLNPVEIPATIADVDVNVPNIPPLKVPVEYDTAALGTLTIQPPPPVPITLEVIPPDLSAVNVDLTAQGAAAGASFAAGLAGSAGAVAAAAASMAAAAQSVSVDLSAQGAAAGASFAAGIASQAGAVAAAAANLGAVAAANKGVYRGRRGIAADRIMLIPHGQAMVKGFIGGMESQKGDLVRASQHLAADVYKAFDDELVPNIGLSGGATMTQKVYVKVEAGLVSDPVKTGRAVADVLNQYAGAAGRASVTVNV